MTVLSKLCTLALGLRSSEKCYCGRVVLFTSRRLRDSQSLSQYFVVIISMFFACLYRSPTGVTRRQFLVNILLDVMVQDTGFTVR